jgi:glucose-1-phosphate adenylyltransferase
MRRKIVAFVLAGGRGNRLLPLTRERSKPAVPFGGKYRMVDFVLSNLINDNCGEEQRPANAAKSGQRQHECNRQQLDGDLGFVHASLVYAR